MAKAPSPPPSVSVSDIVTDAASVTAYVADVESLTMLKVESDDVSRCSRLSEHAAMIYLCVVTGGFAKNVELSSMSLAVAYSKSQPKSGICPVETLRPAKPVSVSVE